MFFGGAEYLPGSRETIPVRFKADTVLGPDKRPRWKKGGEPREFTNRQLWWNLHDPDYKELLDTRGKNDVNVWWRLLMPVYARSALFICAIGKPMKEYIEMNSGQRRQPPSERGLKLNEIS